MGILNAFSGVATIFLLGLLGFVLARTGHVSQEAIAIIPRFLTTIALPPFLMRMTTATMSKDHLLLLFTEIRIPLLSIFLAFILAFILAILLKTPHDRRGMFQVGFATSNAMTIGLPINLALFGEGSLPYALIYFIANALFFWTIGCYLIARSGTVANASFFSLNALKRIFSPPIVGFVIGLVMVYFDFRLPNFLDMSLKYIGDMVVGLSTIYIGMMLSTIRREVLTLDRDIMAVIAGRFIISPILILFLTCLFPVDPLMRNVFVIQASLPVMINAAILTAYYKGDGSYAAVLISVTALLSVITIPIYMAFITLFLS